MPSGITIKRELEQRAQELAERLQHDDITRAHYREQGRLALSTADSILQGLEHSLSQPEGASLTARAGRPEPLPAISIVRPITAPDDGS